MAVSAFQDIVKGCSSSVILALCSATVAIFCYPRLKRAGDSCKAGNTPSGRCFLFLLLTLGFLCWLMALLLYIVEFIRLQQLWTILEQDGCPQKLTCKMLQVFYISMVIYGCLEFGVSVSLVCWRIQELNVLITVIRFKSSDSKSPSALFDDSLPSSPESISSRDAPNLATSSHDPHLSPSVIELSDLRTARASTNQSPDEASDQARTEENLQPSPSNDEAEEPVQPQQLYPDAIERSFRKNAYYMQIAKEELYKRAARNHTGSLNVHASGTPHSDNAGESSSRGLLPVPVVATSAEDASPPISPPAVQPPYPGLNPATIDESPISRCSTCSESHTSTIPHTRRASVREPLTPTSPAKNAVDIANLWDLVDTSAPDLSRKESHASQLRSLLAGIEQRPAENDAVSDASTISDPGDPVQDSPEPPDTASTDSLQPESSVPADEPELDIKSGSTGKAQQSSKNIKHQDAGPANRSQEEAT